MSTILIAENELLTAARLRGCLEKVGYEITLTTTGEEAIELAKANHYDLMLMDIHLDGKIDGITATKSILDACAIPVIFITEQQSEYVFRNVKDIFPQNYLLKPFNDNMVLYAVELALNNTQQIAQKATLEKLESYTDCVYIPAGGYSVKLLFDDILYLKASGAYTDIYYDAKGEKKDNFYKVSISSNHVAAQLAYNALIKVNRSYYINIKKIDRIQKSSVFIDDKEITVSDEHSSELKKRLLFFKH